MKLLVIGHSVEDHFNQDGKDVVKPGGIFYTMLALQKFKTEDDSVFLNTSVSKNNYKLFAGLYDNIPQDYFNYIEKIPAVYLFLHNFKERGETYESISKKLEIKTNNLKHFDGILINMITGFDIDLEQLKEIRQNYKGKIFFDVHTFSRGLDENLKRKFRPIPDFYEWAAALDIIQVNENEIFTISKKETELEIARDILSKGVKSLIVTKGEKGARIYSMKMGEVFSIFKSAVKINAVNKIGCGDVFGAVFFYNYIKTGDVEISLEIANIAAGCSATYKEFENYDLLRQDVFTRYN